LVQGQVNKFMLWQSLHPRRALDTKLGRIQGHSEHRCGKEKNTNIPIRIWTLVV